MLISNLDHFVLTVKDISVSCDFYSNVLGLEVISFGRDRKALRIGNQKINLHQHGEDFDPKAESAVPKWLLDRLGLDFFYSVVQVNLNYSEDGGKREENHNPTDEALQRLANLPNLRVLCQGIIDLWAW